MSQTVSPSTSRSYGLARVSRAWSVSRAGVYRFLKGTPSPAIARRPGPTGPCPDADLADHIRREIEASDFHGEGYRKLWARLRVAGVRSSPRRVRRVMGENGLLAPHRVGRDQEKTHDGTIVTDKVNEMWGTDMSQTFTLEEGRAYVFVVVEHANSEIIGIHAARSANRFEALEHLRPGVHRCFGSIAAGVARGLKLRHDHGSNYMSGDFQDEIKCLGIEASPSFVREPEGNGVAERFIRTLKENLLWVRTFKTIEELRAELIAFAKRYNESWLVARHGYKTPARVREERTCHELQLTERPQPPYPWPPEQAQPSVSKPCRTTIYRDEASGRVLYEKHDGYLWGAAADDGKEPEWLTAQGYDPAEKRPLTIYEILDWLLSLPKIFGKASLEFSFSFGYDATQILKHLPYKVVWEICKRERWAKNKKDRKPIGSTPVYWSEFAFSYIKDKWLEIYHIRDHETNIYVIDETARNCLNMMDISKSMTVSVSFNPVFPT